MSSLDLFLPDDAATAEFGRRLAAALRAGDLLVLTGDLGAGKTALARAVVRSLMADETLTVPSPSFALVQPYERPGCTVVHADLYRLASEREIDELGLFDRADAIVIVEWPERAPGLLEQADVRVDLAIPREKQGRDLTVQLRDDRTV